MGAGGAAQGRAGTKSGGIPGTADSGAGLALPGGVAGPADGGGGGVPPTGPEAGLGVVSPGADPLEESGGAWATARVEAASQATRTVFQGLLMEEPFHTRKTAGAI